MNGQTNTSNSSYQSYEINGTQIILQTLSDSMDTLVKVATCDEDQAGVNYDEEATQVEHEEESIPLVYLDGQVYALRNGELQELDLNHIVDRNDFQDDSIIISRDVHNNDDSECAVITEYISEDNVPIENAEISHEEEFISEDNIPIENTEISHEEKYEVVLDRNEKLIVGKESLNANDFVEVVTAFKCKICPYTTQDRTQLLEHLESVHVNPLTESQKKKEEEELKSGNDVKLVYMCGECSNCFPTIEDCRQHMINDHQLTDRGTDKNIKENRAHRVEQSESFVSSSNDLADSDESKQPQPKVQKESHNGYVIDKKAVEVKDRNIKCSFRGCPYKFSTKEKMQQHTVCHAKSQNANLYKCNLCQGINFAKWRPCSLHLWKKHQIDIDLLSCKVCNTYKSATMVKMLTHLRVHSDNREYECPECGKCFKQSSQLRNHRVMHMDRKTSETQRWYTSKTCEICGKTYADSKCLKNHIQAVHSKLRPYVCNVCGHSSARKAMLQMHLRQHTGDKPFNCGLCEFKTGDHNSLRRHIMRHTGVRPYKCPHCPYSAIQSNSYKNHLRSKHPLLSGSFTCDLCQFKTVKKESYMQHVSDHEKGLIKVPTQKKDDENVEVFPGNIAAAQLIYSCLGAFSKVGKTIEANLMSSSTSADGTSQTITIQIPSKDLEGSLPTSNENPKNNALIEQEDEETMHCFLKIPREEEENIDTGGITIPAETEDPTGFNMNVNN
ncbi:zinc finger protein 845 [Cephus cinctus]|uniref:Zinc finger protein 845 n=1 Tax=Cephus cinctus TaxID=211228 RepID=A0AAJ7FEF5_CEPCN|nr:zinc finger protein 845 [Cephus cinctus]